MKYKGSGNNIYSSGNIDPEFVEYLHSIPAEFLQQLYLVWGATNAAKIVRIDVKRKRRPRKAITDDNIIDFYQTLKGLKYKGRRNASKKGQGRQSQE